MHGDQEKEFGEQGDPNVTLTEPYGVSDDNTGLYVADTYANRVVKLAKGSGSVLWATSECSATPFDRPRDVAVGSNGDIYVADTDNDRIVRLDAVSGCSASSVIPAPGPDSRRPTVDRGRWRRSVGQRRAGGPSAAVPERRDLRARVVRSAATVRHGTGSVLPIASSWTAGCSAVCDTFNFRIQRLKVTGGDPRYHSTLGGTRPTKGGFNEPFDVAYGPDGVFFVTDSFNHRIEKFNANGDIVTAWGGYGTPNGSFIFPRGIAVDGNRVVVTDSENNRIDLFSLSGSFVDSIKPVGAGNAFSRPHQTAVAGDGSYWVADTLNDRAVHLDVGGNVPHEITAFLGLGVIAVDGPDIYVAYGTGNAVGRAALQRLRCSAGSSRGAPGLG